MKKKKKERIRFISLNVYDLYNFILNTVGCSIINIILHFLKHFFGIKNEMLKIIKLKIISLIKKINGLCQINQWKKKIFQIKMSLKIAFIMKLNIVNEPYNCNRGYAFFKIEKCFLLLFLYGGKYSIKKKQHKQKKTLEPKIKRKKKSGRYNSLEVK